MQASRTRAMLRMIGTSRSCKVRQAEIHRGLLFPSDPERRRCACGSLGADIYFSHSEPRLRLWQVIIPSSWEIRSAPTVEALGAGSFLLRRGRSKRLSRLGAGWHSPAGASLPISPAPMWSNASAASGAPWGDQLLRSGHGWGALRGARVVSSVYEKWVFPLLRRGRSGTGLRLCGTAVMKRGLRDARLLQ
jgi:hypothetical protein